MVFRSLHPDAELAEGLRVAALRVTPPTSEETDGPAVPSTTTDPVAALTGCGEMLDSAIKPEKSNPSGARRIARDR